MARWSDGSEAVLYRPPLRVVLGFRTPPVAKFFTGEQPIEPAEIMNVITMDVHAGPPAVYPRPATARELRWALEDEWLRIERERGIERER